MSKEKDFHEIDLIELFKIFYKNKLLILLITTLSAIFSLYYASNQINYYKSDALLEIIDGSTPPSSGAIGGYASLIGVDIGSSESNMSALIVATIKSKDFFRVVSKNEDIFTIIAASKNYDRDTMSLIYNQSIYNTKKDSWVPKKKPSLLSTHRKYKKMLTVSVSKDTGFLKISVEHISPVFAKQLIDEIVKEINLQFRNKKYEESSRALEYLEKKFQSTSLMPMKNSINQLISANLETQMMSDINKDYALSFIENSYIPENKFRPNKALICILGTIVGFFMSLIIVLFRCYLTKEDLTESKA